MTSRECTRITVDVFLPQVRIIGEDAAGKIVERAGELDSGEPTAGSGIPNDPAVNIFSAYA